MIRGTRIELRQIGCTLHFDDLIVVFVFITCLNDPGTTLSLWVFVSFEQIDEPLYVDQNLVVGLLVRLGTSWGKTCLFCLLV